MNKLKPVLRKSLFWDVDFDGIDYQSHARFVIERVLARGSLNDWRQLCGYYGLERIKNEALQIRYLDKLTLNFCHTFFNIPKEKFRCYNTDPSIRKLWSY
ncbi:MAG: hypothetical protein KAS73_00205 [Candidatus Sabulitectum sp.]|nr:hypothetical protein [Candidatus Sabulitectum sp.]